VEESGGMGSADMVLAPVKANPEQMEPSATTYLLIKQRIRVFFALKKCSKANPEQMEPSATTHLLLE
jgi:hypothetical protein